MVNSNPMAFANEGSFRLIISPAWNSNIQYNKQQLQQYRHLFEMTTPYQSSVIDGIDLLCYDPLGKDFLSLMKSYGRHSFLPKGPYKESYALGCVTLLRGHLFPRVAPFKIKINPSEGGLSVRQVLAWAQFAGDANKLLVRRVDFKVELFNLSTSYYINHIWSAGFRTVDESYKDETLYLGGRFSQKSVIVYDKALQQTVSTLVQVDWTRIEVRERYDKQDQLSVYEFIQTMQSISPFKDLMIVNANQTELNHLLHKYNKTAVAGSVLKTFKQLSTYQRKVILRKLKLHGKLSYLANDFQKQLNEWLRY